MAQTTRSTEIDRFTKHVTPGARALGVRTVIAADEVRQQMEAAGISWPKHVAALGNPKVTAAILEAVPPLALAALEVMVELGGLAPTLLLERYVSDRTKAPRKLVERSIQAALQHMLMLELSGRNSTCWLVDRSAEAVAKNVYGITLPLGPLGVAAPPDKNRECHRIAALGYLAHRTGRPTLSRTIPLGTVKSIAKAVGADPTSLDHWYRSALRAGVLASRGSTVAPTLERLLREADPALRAADPAAAGLAWLPAGAWVSTEALARADRARLDSDKIEYEILSGNFYRTDLAMLRSEWDRQLLRTQGIETLVHDGHRFVRRTPAANGTGKDGYVNPSFEVIVGPACPLAAVAAIALGCELERLDHFMTFSLTPASIANGAACGLSEAALRDALAVSSKHPLPDNVDRSIADWFGRDASVEVAEAIVITGPAAVLDRVEKAWDGSAYPAKRHGPHALAFDRATPRRTLEAALEKANGVLRAEGDDGQSAMRKPDRDDDVVAIAQMASSRAVPPCPLPLLFQGNPALRDRLHQDLRDGFALTTAALKALAPANVSLRPEKPELRHDGCPFCGADHDPAVHDIEGDPWGGDEAEDLLAMLVERCAADLSYVLRSLPSAERHLFATLPAETLIRFCCFSSKVRKKILERSHNLKQFSENVAIGGAPSNDGADFLDSDPIERVGDLLGVLLDEHGIEWRGPKVTEPASQRAEKKAPPDEPRNAIREQKALAQWMKKRNRGDVAWLEVETPEGLLRGVFTIDGVQTRGRETALLVSADWMERGRVVYEREIRGASDAT